MKLDKKRIKFLKLLKKHKVLTAPEICKKLRIKKTSLYSTDYGKLGEYIQWPGWDEEFDSYFNVKHYEDDKETSSRSEFSLRKEGEDYLKSITPNRMNIFTVIIGILGLIIAIVSLSK